MGLEKGERKSQPEIYKSNSEDTDQQKQGIELIQVITKESRLDFVPPPPFLLILPKKTYLGSGRMKHNRRDWTTLKRETKRSRQRKAILTRRKYVKKKEKTPLAGNWSV